MDDKELADTIKELYTKYADLKVVAEKLGISVEIVKKHLAIKRLPIEERKIPLDEIDYHCDSESRAKDIDGLMEHIRKNGLIEPIVVCKSDDEKYAILAGQRRYCAYVMLNKNHPGEGWDKIPAISRGDCDGIEVDANPSDFNDLEGLTRTPMTLEDEVSVCDTLFKKYSDVRIVSETLGISESMVKKYVKFARLPKLLQDNLNILHKNPKTAMNIALEAADILNWFKDGNVPPEKVLELAKELGEKKRKS